MDEVGSAELSPDISSSRSTQERVFKMRAHDGPTKSSSPTKMPPHDTLAQFSFAPATQTTVVTTTTTTTTRFPPLLMRPPKRSHQLDPRQYPLAASPTPAVLKNISFTLGGKATIFREAEDATFALEQVRSPSFILCFTDSFQAAARTERPPRCKWIFASRRELRALRRD